MLQCTKDKTGKVEQHVIKQTKVINKNLLDTAAPKATSYVEDNETMTIHHIWASTCPTYLKHASLLLLTMKHPDV